MAKTPKIVQAPAVVSTPSDPLATRYLDRTKALWSKRTPWMPYYQELADVLLPTQAYFTSTKPPGSETGQGIYDGTPRLALRDLASTLDGLMKPKTSNWFDVTVEDPDLAEQDEVKRWLEVVHERMWSAIYNKNARFIQRSGETDLNISCFGWGVLWLQENKARNGLLFRTFHNSRAAFDENDEGVIDTLAVDEMLTCGQLVAKYEAANKEVPAAIRNIMKDAKKANERSYQLVQLVLPAEDYMAGAMGPKGMPFRSVLLDVKHEQIIGESGFQEFPAAIPRWETAPGEVYARSPGMMALPDARTLQAMGKTLLVGGQRAVDPPLWVQNDAIFSPLRTFPGGITVVDSSDTNGTPVGAFPVSTNLPLGREMQSDYRSMVEAAFFKNVFKLPIEGPSMTAYEVAQRKQEFIRVIGPVFGRLETDYIGHTVERAFGIMERAGAFPQRPDALLEVKVTFRFQSPIQQARKQIEVAGLAQAIESLAPLAEAQPWILDNFDGDQIARDAPEFSGMPQRWLRPIKDRDAQRAAKEQGQAQERALGATLPVSTAVKNIADAASTLQ